MLNLLPVSEGKISVKLRRERRSPLVSEEVRDCLEFSAVSADRGSVLQLLLHHLGEELFCLQALETNLKVQKARRRRVVHANVYSG